VLWIRIKYITKCSTELSSKLATQEDRINEGNIRNVYFKIIFLGWEVDGTGSGSCSIAGNRISGVELSCSATRELVN
jgi:hypothetical protein